MWSTVNVRRQHDNQRGYDGKKRGVVQVSRLGLPVARAGTRLRGGVTGTLGGPKGDFACRVGGRSLSYERGGSGVFMCAMSMAVESRRGLVGGIGGGGIVLAGREPCRFPSPNRAPLLRSPIVIKDNPTNLFYK